MDTIEHEAAPPTLLSEGAANVYQALKTGRTHGGNALKHEHIQTLTVRELGDLAAAQGVSASTLLTGYEPQHAPSKPSE